MRARKIRQVPRLRSRLPIPRLAASSTPCSHQSVIKTRPLGRIRQRRSSPGRRRWVAHRSITTPRRTSRRRSRMRPSCSLSSMRWGCLQWPGSSQACSRMSMSSRSLCSLRTRGRSSPRCPLRCSRSRPLVRSTRSVAHLPSPESLRNSRLSPRTRQSRSCERRWRTTMTHISI